jgi:hypothetical protein
MATTRQRIKLRNDTAANWTAANPVLAAGEIGYETDTKQVKVGNGSSVWSSLEYAPWNRNPTLQSIQLLTSDDVTPGPDQLAWDTDYQTVDLGLPGGVTVHLGSETIILCRNDSNSVAIPKGTAVRFAGSIGNSGRLKVAPMVADGTLPGYVFFGVTDQAIAGGADGYVTVFGKIRGIDTSAYQDGDILWCSPTTPGAFTTTEPTAPNLKLPVAAVVHATNNGTLFVRWTTGNRLKDLHDVEANGSNEEGYTLAWNDSLNRWESKAPANGAPRSITIAGPLVGDSFTLFRTSRETTITSAVALVSGGSVTYELRYAADRTTAGTLATISDVVTNTTTGDSATVQNQPIPADRYVWIEITAVSGTVSEFNLSVAF